MWRCSLCASSSPSTSGIQCGIGWPWGMKKTNGQTKCRNAMKILRRSGLPFSPHSCHATLYHTYYQLCFTGFTHPNLCLYTQTQLDLRHCISLPILCHLLLRNSVCPFFHVAVLIVILELLESNMKPQEPEVDAKIQTFPMKSSFPHMTIFPTKFTHCFIQHRKKIQVNKS